MDLKDYQLKALTKSLDTVVEERDALRTQLAAATARAEAAESALRLATHSAGSTTVLMTLEQYTELLAADKRAEAAERERDAWKQEADDERKSMRSAVRVMQERAEAAEAQLALVERYGADQWRRGNAGKEPQEFAEWQREVGA